MICTRRTTSIVTAIKTMGIGIMAKPSQPHHGKGVTQCVPSPPAEHDTNAVQIRVMLAPHHKMNQTARVRRKKLALVTELLDHERGVRMAARPSPREGGWGRQARAATPGAVRSTPGERRGTARRGPRNNKAHLTGWGRWAYCLSSIGSNVRCW